MRRKKLLFAGILLSIGLLIALKDAYTSWDVELEKIVVTPSRTQEDYSESGRKVDVISPRDLEYSHYSGLSEALEENIPSIGISDYGSLGAQKTIYMRGSNASQVLVLVDGRPVNSPRSGDVNLNTIPLDNVGRIEVMRGPASSIYGSSAMGGVVNIISKEPPRKGRSIELLSSFGTFRTYQEEFSLGERINNFGYRFDAAYQSSEGHRDNSEFNAKDANAKVSYEFSPENKLMLNGGFYKDKLGAPGSITFLDLDDKQLDKKNYFDMSWDIKPWVDKDIRVSARAYQNYDRLEFIETPDPLDKTTHTTKARGLNLQYNQGISQDYRLICGFDGIDNLNDSTASAKHDYTVRAGYLQNQLALRENLKTDFGLRVDDYSNFGTEISPSFNLLYRLKDNTKAHFLIARSFRAPTFNDIYWPATGFEEGNPNLQPEKGVTGEFGIEKDFSKFLKIGLTYFRSAYRNLIRWQEDSDNIWRPKNIDSAIIDGIEQELKFEPFSSLNIDLGYTYLRAKDNKTHKYIIYQPKHKANLYLNYKTKTGFNIGLNSYFVDRRFHNAANTTIVKRYYTLGLKLSKDIKDLNLFFNIDNLLNKKYQYVRNYPLPGFSVTGGAKLKF